MSPMKPCTRFREDGSACTNRTDYGDGWCRQADCPGFARPDPELAPTTEGPPSGTVNHIKKTGNLPIGDVTVEDIPTIHVAKNAIDRFRHHHGGNRPEAEVQLRCMLEDFLLKSARSVSSGKRLKLAREGYAIFLSPAGDTITSYSTVHRERTWEQVKSGVKSRFRKASAQEASGPPPERGLQVDLSAFGTTFDPRSAHLTSQTRTSYAKKAGLREVPDEELDASIRAACAEFKSGDVVQRENGCFEIHEGGRIWLVSPDCRSVYRFSDPDGSLDGPNGKLGVEIPDVSQAQPKAKKKIPDKTGRPTAKSAKGRSKQAKCKKASSKKKPKTQLASDIREYFDIDRAKDDHVDRRSKAPYLGIFKVSSVTSAGAPGHGKRR